MPANDMFSPTITALRIEVEDLTTKGEPGFSVWLKQQREGGVLETLAVVKLSGLEVDFLSTLVADAFSAWLYGQQGDVLRAVQGISRQAKRHARLHDDPLFR